jgi:hypothetical protein
VLLAARSEPLIWLNLYDEQHRTPKQNLPTKNTKACVNKYPQLSNNVMCLYKGDKKVISFSNIANTGHYKFKIPYAAKPGKDYRFRITDYRNKDQIVFSQPFEVTRKYPLALKAMPFVLIGMGIMIAKTCTPDTAD